MLMTQHQLALSIAQDEQDTVSFGNAVYDAMVHNYAAFDAYIESITPKAKQVPAYWGDVWNIVDSQGERIEAELDVLYRFDPMTYAKLEEQYENSPTPFLAAKIHGWNFLIDILPDHDDSIMWLQDDLDRALNDIAPDGYAYMMDNCESTRGFYPNPDSEDYIGGYEPDEGDYVISDSNYLGHYKVEQFNRTIQSMLPYQAMLEWIANHMEKEQFWPNVWYVNDHGNINQVDMNED